MANVAIERRWRHDIHAMAETGLELLLEVDQVHKAAASFHIDEQIDITVRSLFASGDRAEQAGVGRAIIARSSSRLATIASRVDIGATMPTLNELAANITGDRPSVSPA